MPAVPDAPPSLAGRSPRVEPERLVASLVPPPRFADTRFSGYEPDPDEPSQAQARDVVEAFGQRLGQDRSGGVLSRLLGNRRGGGSSDEPAGVYLDGGFGVGKTHLLASLWHAAPEPKAYGTFVEYTNLVGALGFEATVAALADHRLVAIDEFELDDPGDTVLVSTLLTRLVEGGAAVAATSNTLPGELGSGRFAADDFLREIQGLAARFRPVRVEGEDYRHRGTPSPPPPLSDEDVRAAVAGRDRATLDGFDALADHLASLHPSRYRAMLDGVQAVGLTGVRTVEDQGVALRLVVLADRLYDREVALFASGVPLDRMFGEEMLDGGYRKKYLRSVSRLTALARQPGAA